jgi:hypothetical protein
MTDTSTVPRKLGYEKHDPAGRGSGNSRNGSTGKTVLTDVGAVDLAVPRDRNGSFEPQIVRKGQTRLKGFNERIIALYARGMTTRDIRAHLGRAVNRADEGRSKPAWLLHFAAHCQSVRPLATRLPQQRDLGVAALWQRA